MIRGLPPELARGVAGVLAARSGKADDYNPGSRIEAANKRNPGASKRADTDCPNSADAFRGSASSRRLRLGLHPGTL